MKHWTQTLTVGLILFVLSATIYAQKDNSGKQSDFNKYEAFSALFMNGQTNAFHSATGNPGPDYWQNRADYEIKATLDTVDQKITGQMTLTYTNNSPYKLHFIWLQLDQNTFKKNSRGSALYPAEDRNGVRYFTKGYDLKKVSVGKNKADYVVTDTRMKINLSNPLKPNKKVKVNIDYSFEIPTHGKDRMGRLKTKNGTIYTIAQWYPRMAVYDEVEGWNNLPYLGTGEFYLDYGDFDYEITAPENMLVVGSGVLQNPKKVLTKTERRRLKKARKSDKTVTILSKEEMESGEQHATGKNGMLTWHFKMENSRDVSWAASKAFIWDAARMNLPDKKALAQSVYPVENSGQDGYGRSTEYTKRSIEINSKNWYPYPYKVATNVAGHEGGMEYPGIVFCSYKSKNKNLWNVVNHEFGHTWFPMVVGSNERKYGWLDESFNMFINDVATKEFNNGEYYSKTDFQGKGSMVFNANLDPVFTVPDVIHNQYNLGIEAYYKPQIALQVLRNVVLGKKRFDQAFRTYIRRWAYKHPQPWDFFNTMNNVSGEDLGWYFKGWYIKNWSNDQAVTAVDYVNDDPSQGAEITLLNKGEMAMPVLLQITFENGRTKDVKLPVEIWMTGSHYVYHLHSDSKIKSVKIDPDHLVPDANPMNNELKKLASAPQGMTAQKIFSDYVKAIGGKDKLNNIRDISKTMNAQIQGMPIQLKLMGKKPDKFLQTVTVRGNEVQKMVVNGDEVSLYQQGQKQDLNAQEKEMVKKQEKEMFPELSYMKYGKNLKLLGVKSDNGTQLYVVESEQSDGNTVKSYYDASTGLLVEQKSAQGVHVSLSDYREVNGIKIPFKISSNQMGREMDMTVEDAKINSGLKDSDFE